MAKEHLVKARALIENGWAKRELKQEIDGNPCYCLDGALAEAHGYDAENETADIDIYDKLCTDVNLHEDVVRVANVLPDHFKKLLHNRIEYAKNTDSDSFSKEFWIKEVYSTSLYRFNDSSVVRKQDVLDVLDAAIVQAE